MPTASLINAWADNVITTSPIIHYKALHSMFSISLLRYVQLSLVAQGIFQAKIENFSIFFQIPKSHMTILLRADNTPRKILFKPYFSWSQKVIFLVDAQGQRLTLRGCETER